ATPSQLTIKPGTSTEYYYCSATNTSTGTTTYSSAFIVKAYGPNDAVEYLKVLSHIRSVVYPGEKMSYRVEAHKYMTQAWNTTMDSQNLAQAILTASTTSTEYTKLLCTCCIDENGVVSSDILWAHGAAHKSGCPWEVYTVTLPIPEQPPFYGETPNGAQYENNSTHKLPMTQAIILPANDSATVVVGVSGVSAYSRGGSYQYQWQVYNGSEWANMLGEYSSTLIVTTAKLQTIFDLTGVAHLRYYDRMNDVVLGYVDVTSQENANGEYPEEENTEDTQNLLLTSRETVTSTTYPVTIDYVLEGTTTSVGQSYSAWIAAGTGLDTVITLPAVPGYKPGKVTGEVEGKVTCTVTAEKNTETKLWEGTAALLVNEIDRSIELKIEYVPVEVEYTVVYHQQNVADDNYTEVKRETLTALTNKTMPAVDVSYSGFYQLKYEQPAIAADGSTLVGIYYDRYYYLMNFDLDGGYGVEPIYARYGKPIGNVGTPTKAGYSFAGWSLDGTTVVDLPSTMPAENRTYKAVWGNPQTVNYTVVYWRENANDSNYSFWGSEIKQVAAGSTVSGSDSIPSSISTTTVEGSTIDEKVFFTYNAAKTDKNVVIKGDGSSVVNVYYTRKYYTIRFTGYGKCALTEHTHTDNCKTNRSDNVIYVLTAKYEQNIADVWPTYDVLKNGGFAYVNTTGNVVNRNNQSFRGWDIDGVSSEAVSKRVTMTSDLCDTSDGVKEAKAQYSTNYYVHLYYMFESFDQTSLANGNERIYYNGKYYDKSKAFYQDVYANSSSFGQKKITGMKDVGVETERVGGRYSTEYNNFLYYDRNRSTLAFQNIDTVVKSVSNIMFEQPLKDYKDSDGNLLSSFVPDYPSTLEPNAFEFKGWYTTPECYDGTEFDFSKATMPNADLTLYAKWAPVTHTVQFYLNKAAMEAGTELESHSSITVPHGSKATPTPADPTNGSYTFVGWFYMENGVEKAFDFANMPVNKDLQVYGKWSSNVLKEYKIYYKTKVTNTETGEVEKIEIAAPTIGQALAGVEKTFDAKGGTDLYTAYQKGFFPETPSHTLIIDIDGTNEYTFWYVQKEAVPYEVYYLAETVEKPEDYQTIEKDGKSYYIVHATKIVSDNRSAVVTETFEVVQGMMPDAYQKRLVVSAADGAVNEIIFYYTIDTAHAYYKITHYTEALDGNWVVYAETQAQGDIGKTYTAEPMRIPGFTYDSSVQGTLTSGKLTANGLELKLYYTRNSYPYQVRYLEQGTGTQLHDPTNGTGKYGQVISESAIDITNYTAVAPTSQTLNIRIEEGTEAKLNIITFYYTENEATINYVVVGPEGCGTVSPTSETL
ncbi:MAG: InlB B-repeat-containing protein, partial [bacterium]|nr:InlB B-repeat-containing protein [bacterium]